MEIANVIDEQGILSFRATWERDYQAQEAAIAKLQEEIDAKRRTMQALSGAVQACDVFLKQLQTNSVPIKGMEVDGTVGAPV